MPERNHPLLRGFREFHEKTYKGDSPVMPRLAAEGQNPDYFIISCIDSRSNPGMIFNPAPGTFLAHKAMGAIVRPYKKGTALAAALQFAFIHNNVKEIVVLGHTGCGAIKALVEKLDDDEIASFIDVAQAGLQKAREKHACDSTHDDLYRHAEEEIVLQSGQNLRSYPSVAKALEESRVKIRLWLFDMEGGQLYAYNDAQDRFITITKDEEAEG